MTRDRCSFCGHIFGDDEDIALIRGRSVINSALEIVVAYSCATSFCGVGNSLRYSMTVDAELNAEGIWVETKVEK